MSKRPAAPRRRALLPAAVLALLAGTVTGCTSKPAADADTTAQRPTAFKVSAEQRTRLTILTAATETFHPTLEVTGTVAFNGDRSTQLISPISGPVSRVMVPLGAHVSQGDVLALVSSPDFADAVATYRKAEDAARNTQRILTLNEQLFANDALARSDLDQSRSDASSAVADRDAAALSLRALGLDAATIAAIRDGKQAAPVEGAIRATIPGIMVEKLITPGQLMEAGATTAFTVADLSSMWVFASVYGADIALVTAGERVDVLVDGTTKTVEGHVDYVAPIVDPETKAANVRILADNPRGLLKRDQFVRLVIHAVRPVTGILVPSAAVLRDDDNLPFVIMAGADGSFLRRRVTLGHRIGDRYELSSGVAAGEHVVTNGALFIQFAESQ